MDSDLGDMTREQLLAEVVKLRSAIRAHRDSSGQDLCWHQPALWALLPEPSTVVPEVPEWPHSSADVCDIGNPWMSNFRSHRALRKSSKDRRKGDYAGLRSTAALKEPSM